jgi:hypothetical protein
MSLNIAIFRSLIILGSSIGMGGSSQILMEPRKERNGRLFSNPDGPKPLAIYL